MFRLARSRAVAAALAAVVYVGVAGDARASGLYFSDRGVVPLSRGGAWVAGANDVGSIWYNPAGLADAGTSILADFSWLHFTSEFTRRTQVVDAAGTVRIFKSPTVNGTSPVLPIPTIGGSYNFGKKKEFTAAGAIYAPYTAITSYPTQVNGQPSPSRYSLVSLDGSALVGLGGWFAYKPIEQIRLGAGVGALVGTFASSVYFNASPSDRLIGAPEDPNYDAFGQIKVGPIIAPTGNLGVTAVPLEWLRLGVSFNLPVWVNSPGTLQVRLPNAVVFDNASVSGEDVNVKFTLPMIFRAGLEVRPVKPLAVEVTFVREFWSQHDEIAIAPKDVSLVNVTGFPSPFKVSPLVLPRNFADSNSYRAGAQYTVKLTESYTLDMRLGVNYDQSAIPTAYLSPLTIDLDKFTTALGGSLYVGEHWRFDAVFAHIFTKDRDVDPAEAAIPRVNPVRGNPTATEAINGGSYSARADVLGVGLRYQFK
jgi:long-chain fatty acid transport protein